MIEYRSALIGVLIGVSAGAVWMRASPQKKPEFANVQECMVREMVGQPVAMMATVNLHCKKLLRVEEAVAIGSFAYKLKIDKDGDATVLISPPEAGERRLARARVAFSNSPCSTPQEPDTDKVLETFVIDGSAIFFKSELGFRPQCSRTLALWATY